MQSFNLVKRSYASNSIVWNWCSRDSLRLIVGSNVSELIEIRRSKCGTALCSTLDRLITIYWSLL